MSLARQILVQQSVGALVLALALQTTVANAAVVAIVRPANPPPLIVETLGRISGELASLGFVTEIVDEPTIAGDEQTDAARHWLEQLASERRFDAVLAFEGYASRDSVEVWVIDKVTQKSIVRTVHLDRKDQRIPKTLSVRAIELLRSSFLELDLSANEPLTPSNTAPPPAVVAFLEKARLAQRPERIGIELGGVAIGSLGGLGPALMPVVRANWAIHSPLLVQLTFSGLGTQPTVENREGSAQVAQAYALLGASYGYATTPRFAPFLSLAAGILYTSVEGWTESPNNLPRQANRLSFLFDGGAGARFRTIDRLFVSIGVHAQWAEPRPAIRLVERVVAKSASPNLLLTLTVGAWL